jgi:hypothetical protein
LKTADLIRAKAYDAQWRIERVLLPKIREAMKPLNDELQRRMAELGRQSSGNSAP